MQTDSILQFVSSYMPEGIARIIAIVAKLLLAAFGASLLKLYHLGDEKTSAVPFLRVILPNKSSQYYITFDFILSIVVGSIFSVALFNPLNVHASIAGGLGWQGALTSFPQREIVEESK